MASIAVMIGICTPVAHERYEDGDDAKAETAETGRKPKRPPVLDSWTLGFKICSVQPEREKERERVTYVV